LRSAIGPNAASPNRPLRTWIVLFDIPRLHLCLLR